MADASVTSEQILRLYCIATPIAVPHTKSLHRDIISQDKEHLMDQTHIIESRTCDETTEAATVGSCAFR
jgi:hypothetical protein